MQRPASATVFGILNIVFAALGIFGLLASLALLRLAGDTNNPVVKIMQSNPTFAMWIKMSIPLGVAACAVLLAAGIGLLLMKSWARKLSIAYAIYALVYGLAGIVVNFFFLVRPLLAEAAQKHGPEAAGAIGGAVGGTIGGCFGLVYPVLLLIFMTRAKLVAAFQPADAPQDFPPTA